MEQDEIDKLVDWQLSNTHSYSYLTRQPMITIKNDTDWCYPAVWNSERASNE